MLLPFASFSDFAPQRSNCTANSTVTGRRHVETIPLHHCRRISRIASSWVLAVTQVSPKQVQVCPSIRCPISSIEVEGFTEILQQCKGHNDTENY